MSLKHEFNRIGNLLNGGVTKTQHQAGHWADKGARQAQEISRRVRHRVESGTGGVVSVEEAIVQHVRENPAVYIFGVALVIGALIAKLFLETRRVPEPPLL